MKSNKHIKLFEDFSPRDLHKIGIGGPGDSAKKLFNDFIESAEGKARIKELKAKYKKYTSPASDDRNDFVDALAAAISAGTDPEEWKEMKTEVEDLILDGYCYDDPTPWCSGCGAMSKDKCTCGPIADNE